MQIVDRKQVVWRTSRQWELELLVVTTTKGPLRNAANLVWAKGIVPLAEMFEDKLGHSGSFTNDANAAAIGEK